MSAIFLDLKEGDLAIYTVGKNGGSGIIRERISMPPGAGYTFNTEGSFRDNDESYLSLPLSLLNFRVLELPFSDMKQIMEVLPFELEAMILGGSSGVAFDAYPLGESN